ncbi:S-glutathionyl-(chloro)hydroquinone reductase [Dimargaris cristalligena]|uniref:Glutathione S-transferase n=1 Tax=Dimargaris cristalligena TaxID=215637 RepID=A0A4P9ZR59_9FUNG|nr:S-glutathionyl-(chloro)hydroquinone reductase [Dimargaris cristalligena]RKP35825.1 glutathione S-transferase [Dimargaris cristalligena]|eukprot:RKP35825.1 glutathione S-transferase [Dimargaris cristalligena]
MATSSKYANVSETQKWANKDGEFNRPPSAYRHWISQEPGTAFPPEAGRYHLYASYGCPWAHRTIIVRALKGLESIIDLSVFHPVITDQGWQFDLNREFPGDTAGEDPLHLEFQYARQLYFKSNPDHVGRFTVPILWDSKTEQVVNNESSEIIRMFNSAFDDLLSPSNAGAAVRGAHTTDPAYQLGQALDLYPEAQRAAIDEINEWVYDTVNNGVYKTGFTLKQDVYEHHCQRVFGSLDRLESILTQSEFLVGDRLTEADVRLFTTIVRFDPAYHGIFKCNLKSIGSDYPHILRWARRVYQVPTVGQTVKIPHIKAIYYGGMSSINPNGIIPLGNGPDLSHPTIKPGTL